MKFKVIFFSLMVSGLAFATEQPEEFRETTTVRIDIKDSCLNHLFGR